jgi:membrane protein
VRSSSEQIQISSRQNEKLTLMVMYWIGKHYVLASQAWTLDTLSSKLGVPSYILSQILNTLIEKGLIVETASMPSTYLPANDLDAIQLKELIAVTRNAGSDDMNISEGTLPETDVDVLLQRLDQAYEDALGNSTVRDWIKKPGES